MANCKFFGAGDLFGEYLWSLRPVVSKHMVPIRGQSCRLHCPEEPEMLLCSKAKASTVLKLERSSTPTCLITSQDTQLLSFKVMIITHFLQKAFLKLPCLSPIL